MFPGNPRLDCMHRGDRLRKISRINYVSGEVDDVNMSGYTGKKRINSLDDCSAFEFDSELITQFHNFSLLPLLPNAIHYALLN